MNTWHRIFVSVVSWINILFIFAFAASGFEAGTQVQTPNDLVAIEEINVGDVVYCRNAAGDQETSYVAAITTSQPEIYAFISWGIDTVVTSADQLFLGFTPESTTSSWIKAEAITTKHRLLGGYGQAALTPKRVEQVRWHDLDDPPLLYSLSVAGEHNFLITQNGITVHNFVIVLPVLSFAFGAGGTATAVTAGKLLFDALIAGLFLTAVEALAPGSTRNYEYTAQGNMCQIQGQGSNRADAWHGNVDQRCRQVPTPADIEKQREQQANAAIAAEERARRLQSERDNWSPAERFANWVTGAPAWWHKKFFGKTEQPKVVLIDVPPLETPALTLTPSPLENEAVAQLHTQFKQRQTAAQIDAAATASLNNQINQLFTHPGYADLDPGVKQCLTQQAYEWLYAAGKLPTQDHLRVQLTIATALHKLHQYELRCSP